MQKRQLVMKVSADNVLSLLLEEFQYDSERVTLPTVQERRICKHIADILKAESDSEIATECSLDYSDSLSTKIKYEELEAHLWKQTEYDVFSDSVSYRSTRQGNYDRTITENVTDEEYTPEVVNIEQKVISLNDKKAAVLYWRSSAKKKRRNISSVQHSFRFVLSESQLYRWEKQLERGGDRINKLTLLYKGVQKRFDDAKREGACIHDTDIMRWAAEEAVLVKLDKFCASRRFVANFKQNLRIVGRKITKFMAGNSLQEEDALVQRGKSFVSEQAEDVKQIGPANVYNADHVGLVRELHSGRTLDYIGETNVFKIPCKIEDVQT